MKSISSLVLRANSLQSVQTGLRPIAPAYGSRSLQVMSGKVFGFGSHNADNDPEKLEAEKRKNLQGDAAKGKEEKNHHMPGSAGWNENLASDSEAAVKAEKHAPDSVEEMQKLSVKHLHGEVDEQPATTEKDPLKKGKAKPVK